MDFPFDPIRDLSAPIRSFRVFAIEEALRKGSSSDLLAALRARALEESDEECSLLLSHAIVSVKNRLESSSSPDLSGLSSDDFGKRFADGLPATRLELLMKLTPGKAQELSAQANGWLDREADPAVLSALIRVFGPVLPASGLEVLLPKLESPHISVRGAALEVIVDRNPEMLAAELPRLLSSDIPRFRASAIRGLGRIDPEEAVRQVQSLLFGADTHERFCGIHASFFLPFAQVKSVMLRFLSREHHPMLLEKAGLLFQSNPDIEAPFRLWEILEQSAPEKAAAMKKIVEGACDVLKNSEILGEDFPGYLERLHAWAKRRITVKKVQELLVEVMGSASSPRPCLDFEVFKGMPSGDVRCALEEALSWHLPPEIQDQIRRFLETPKNLDFTTKVQESEVVCEGPFALEEAPKLLSRITRDNAKNAVPLLKSVLDHPKASPELLATAFRTAQRLGIRDLVGDSERFLSGKDATILGAALDYLGSVEPEKVHPLLMNFLKVRTPVLFRVAFKLLVRFDQSRALSLIEGMILSQNPQDLSLALAGMVHFDFPNIREMVFEILLRKPPTEVFHMGLALFQANPEWENLYLLFRLEKSLPTDYSKECSLVRRQNETALLEMGIIPAQLLESLEPSFADRLKKERDMLPLRMQPPFLQPTDQTGFWGGLLSLFAVGRGRGSPPGFDRSSLWLLLVFVSMGVVGFVFLGPWMFPQTSVRAGGAKPGAVLPSPISVSGEILDVREKSGCFLLKGEDGRQYVALSDGRPIPTFRVGEKWKVLLVPFRVNSEGQVVSQVQRWERY